MRAQRRPVGILGRSGVVWAAVWRLGVTALGLVLWASGWAEVRAAQGPAPPGRASRSAVRTRAASPLRPSARPSAAVNRGQATLPSDDWTFRPTVVVRRGSSQGSGTIIASIEGATLVLTAAHVVSDPGPITVELHRYNLGLERTQPTSGSWPRPLAADLVATDPAADLAILRIARVGPLPYVAHLGLNPPEPAPDSVVTSIGFDLGARLSSWSSWLVEALWFELNESHDERLFLITERAPEHGRSGGGLFLADGALVGVCVGHAELVEGRRMGVFASGESIRRLILDHNLAPILVSSQRRRSRFDRRGSSRLADTRAQVPVPAAVTPTGALEGDGE
ncbi:MAG TPA: serine protease [Isosphaeraceae bacterium]|nr:serine protease [Isosphaeraceae bacterium]